MATIKRFEDFKTETVNERNMSYVRFENTLSDLRDCYENMDEASSESEKRARRDLIALCADIANEYEGQFDDLEETYPDEDVDRNSTDFNPED